MFPQNRGQLPPENGRELSSRRRAVLRAAAAAAAVAAVAGTLAISGRGCARDPSSHDTIAALGDSLTRAFASAGEAEDNVTASWATGDHPAVRSHYARLGRAMRVAGEAGNYAVTGSLMEDTLAQAARAAGGDARYVTILSGTNDVCADTAAGMTRVEEFSAQLRSTLRRLTTELPSAQILVASIPDWYEHWRRYRTSAAAQRAWATNYGGICRALFGAEAARAERLGVRRRIRELNEALRRVCGEFASCAYDGGAVHTLTFDLRDLAFDYFHPSVQGQARIAAATWRAAPYRAARSTGGKR